MNNAKLNCSLNDTTELRKMILDYPDLPLLVFTGEESYTGEYGYNQADVTKVDVEKLTLFEDMWLDEDDYKDKLFDQLDGDGKYIDLTDKEFDGMIDKKVKETEFVDAIVVWVG